jgi:hypothetical protein
MRSPSNSASTAKHLVTTVRGLSERGVGLSVLTGQGGTKPPVDAAAGPWQLPVPPAGLSTLPRKRHIYSRQAENLFAFTA